ncbi:MAG: hypothetical protein ACK5MQ_18115 [Pikeienuella sp.]
MPITEPGMISGERALYRKGANFIASVTEADLDRFFADQLMWLAGMQGAEAIGGHLYVTNFRLVFVAHAINRLRGRFSIPLPKIDQARREARFPIYKLIVETGRGRYEFVNWSVRSALRAIEENKGNRSADLEAEMRGALNHNEPLCLLNALFLPRRALADARGDRPPE